MDDRSSRPDPADRYGTLKTLLDADYQRIQDALAGEVSELHALRAFVGGERAQLERERAELEAARAASRRELWGIQQARDELEAAHADEAEWREIGRARAELEAAAVALAERGQ